MVLDPEEAIKPLQLPDDALVADLGSGSGVFTLAAAKRVSRGKVYAIDIQRDLLPVAKSRAEGAGSMNVEIIWGNVEEVGGTKLADEAVSAVIFSNLLFHLEDKKTAAAEAFRILRPNGKILLVDWSGSFNTVGPRAKDVVPQMDARRIFEEVGFVFLQNAPAGDHHYGLIFRKP